VPSTPRCLVGRTTTTWDEGHLCPAVRRIIEAGMDESAPCSPGALRPPRTPSALLAVLGLLQYEAVALHCDLSADLRRAEGI